MLQKQNGNTTTALDHDLTPFTLYKSLGILTYPVEQVEHRKLTRNLGSKVHFYIFKKEKN